MLAAAALLAPGGLEPNCSLCHDPANRTKWGCDQPAPLPVVDISPCPFCGGADDKCPDCHGTNHIGIHTCPRKLIQPIHTEMVMATLRVEEGILPDQGGWNDQSATFCRAYEVCIAEIHHWRAVWRKKQQRGS